MAHNCLPYSEDEFKHKKQLSHKYKRSSTDKKFALLEIYNYNTPHILGFSHQSQPTFLQPPNQPQK
jgi:hypothetical protein